MHAEDSPGIRAALEEVPVHFEQDGDSVLISGLPGDLIKALIDSYMGDRCPIRCTHYQHACNCTFKTALVPAGNQGWWRTLMEHAPFGGSA
eukprot:3151579-Pyramimonas_sp.AAC.1